MIITIIVYMLITLLFMLYLINVELDIEGDSNCKKIIWINKNDAIIDWVYLYIVFFFSTWFILPSIIYYKCVLFLYRNK